MHSSFLLNYLSFGWILLEIGKKMKKTEQILDFANRNMGCIHQRKDPQEDPTWGTWPIVSQCGHDSLVYVDYVFYSVLLASMFLDNVLIRFEFSKCWKQVYKKPILGSYIQKIYIF